MEEKITIHQLAPIALFAYIRPNMLKRTLESLEKNEQVRHSELFIFCDGAKLNALPQQIENINEVRRLADSVTFAKKCTVIKAESNMGLANSIIFGVTKIVSEYKKIIVIEDDVLLSPYFLEFMNDSLITFANEPKVCSVGSWNYYTNPKELKTNFFLRYPDTIAWATWDKAWQVFEPDAKELLSTLKKHNKLKKFNIDGASSFFEKTLESQINGKVDSWAIRWTASAILHEMLSLYPQYCLSKHIGYGEGATHEVGGDNFDTGVDIYLEKVSVNKMPIQESQTALNNWKQFLTGLEKQNKIYQLKERIKKIIPNIIKDKIKRLIRQKS